MNVISLETERAKRQPEPRRMSELDKAILFTLSLAFGFGCCGGAFVAIAVGGMG